MESGCETIRLKPEYTLSACVIKENAGRKLIIYRELKTAAIRARNTLDTMGRERTGARKAVNGKAQ